MIPQNNTFEGTGQRILSLDVLRGFAVLGILVMNIQSFSMPSAAYINPTAYGNLEGINLWVWILSHLLAAEKFMTLFSMLFGAGVLLFSERAESREKNSALLHYRRMGWLLLFGLLHAYLLWHGDILVCYSLCGMLVFLFRKKSPRTLLILAAGFFVVPMILNSLSGMSIPYWPEAQVQELMQDWKPSELQLQDELLAYRSGWAGQMGKRMEEALFMQTFLFLMQTFWRVMAMMLLGMALFKLRILTAERSGVFYRNMTGVGLFTGFLLVGAGIWMNFRNDWSLGYSMFFGIQYNYLGSVAVALGYLGIFMGISRWKRAGSLKRVLALAGRMAFTNYILMTLLATFLFYGHGLGLYGSVERWQQFLLTIGIWGFVLTVSALWLKHFRYGPLEWLWRSLTYWRRQTFTGSD
jgi:uncharacterized protein